MADMTFPEVIRAVHNLDIQQKKALALLLEQELGKSQDVTREQLLADLATRKASGIEQGSLSGIIPPPNPSWADGELEAYLHEISTAWESEIGHILL